MGGHLKKGVTTDLHAKFSDDILEIIDNLVEAIAVYDDEDRLIFFNQAFLTINPKPGATAPTRLATSREN